MVFDPRTPGSHSDENDPFKPPAEPVEVSCLHCGNTYNSAQIAWREDPARGGFWACPMQGCDGAGFCFDIWPTDPEWRDEHGNKVWIDDDEEAEPDEDDEA